ncbi:MAG: PEP-CTERM sorting domain-containing protein [Myxococcales bacterium]|nr:PEP-CTERM sorting domain-containing protein [Myxococcales bacterium]HIK86015.1 PEP-CTERM sorting domain-containing protein [Myxococcales bacterium]
MRLSVMWVGLRMQSNNEVGTVDQGVKMGRLSSLVAGLLLLAATAGAAPIETAYTLDGQVGPVTYTGGSVTLDPVLSGGPDPFLNVSNINIECLDGSCDIETQDWVLFEVSVVSGNVGEVGLTLLDSFASGLNALGIGYLLGGGPIQDGGGATDLYSGNIIDPDLPIFNFEANGGGAGVTGTSLVLFVAYGDGLLPHTPTNFGAFGDGAVSFMIAPFGGAGIQSGQGNFTTPIDVIPEPTTGLLMGLGLAMLGVHARRRRG